MHRYQEPDFEEDRIVVRDDEPKKGWFSRKSKSSKPPPKVSQPPGASTFVRKPPKSREGPLEDELPPRLGDDGERPINLLMLNKLTSPCMPALFLMPSKL